MTDHKLPVSHRRAQPFDEDDVPADYVTLTQPPLLTTARRLKGGLYGFGARDWDRRRLALAQRYGEEMADDEVPVDDWPQGRY